MSVFQIDGMDMVYQPAHVRVVPAPPVVYPLAGAGKVVVQPATPGKIEARWGETGAPSNIVNELRLLRDDNPLHTLTWSGEDEMTLWEAVVFFPEIPVGQGLPFTVDSFTLVFEALEPIGLAGAS